MNNSEKIIEASKYGDLKKVMNLLNEGVDVNSKEEDGYTTLHWAVQEGYEDIVLIGHSFGGAIALMYALRYPQELQGIIIIGSGARLRVHPVFLAPCEEAIKGSPQKWYELVEEMYRLTPQDYKREMVEKQKTIGPAVMLNDFLCCDKFDVMDRVHGIKVPTLIICGESDVMTPVKFANYLRDKIADSRVVVVPQSGHFVFAEKPEAVNEAIEDFLKGISS